MIGLPRYNEVLTLCSSFDQTRNRILAEKYVFDSHYYVKRICSTSDIELVPKTENPAFHNAFCPYVTIHLSEGKGQLSVSISSRLRRSVELFILLLYLFPIIVLGASFVFSNAKQPLLLFFLFSIIFCIISFTFTQISFYYSNQSLIDRIHSTIKNHDQTM